MSFEIRVGRLRRDRGFSVARPSPLGNPFRIGVDGDRAQVITKYRAWFEKALTEDERVQAKVEMIADEAARRDVTLLCHCAPEACHADVIADEVRRRVRM